MFVKNKSSLRILLTNHHLGDPGGTQTNVRDWAIGLLRRGHRPVVYAPMLGKTAEVLREQSIPVVDNLSSMTEAPDIIHGNHTTTVLEAIVRFPQVPAIQLCQGINYPLNEPLKVSQVRKYIAVSEMTRDYLVSEGGISPELIAVVYNAVDLARIPTRAQPLSQPPRRALILTATQNQVPIIEEVCTRKGIVLDKLGRGVGAVVMDPERHLPNYDIVFAVGRSAMEAILSGAATVVVDGHGLAGLATRKNVDWLREHNFGLRALGREVTVESISAEIERYDPFEAVAVAAHLRPLVKLEAQLDVFESIYAQVIEAFDPAQHDSGKLLNELVPVLRKWLPQFPGTTWAWQFEKATHLERIEQLDALLASVRKDNLAKLSATNDALQSARLALTASQDAFSESETDRISLLVENRELRAQSADLKRQLAEILDSTSWRASAPMRAFRKLLRERR